MSLLDGTVVTLNIIFMCIRCNCDVIGYITELDLTVMRL